MTHSHPGRLLFVHAHPDDETLVTGTTIAHYCHLGVEVHVITCTLGEEGEVIDPYWSYLLAGHADQLGGYRISELAQALKALGVHHHYFLGGPGRWRDSGMAHSPGVGHNRFIDAPDCETIGALTQLICTIRPHAVITYDPTGGYGHPDHIHTHYITTQAITQAQYPQPGVSPWVVPRFYWVVASREVIAEAYANLTMCDIAPGWRWPVTGAESSITQYDASEIDVIIEDTQVTHKKIRALQAHATQLRLGPTHKAFALTNHYPQPLLSTEYYHLANPSGLWDRHQPAHDLLAGLALI